MKRILVVLALFVLVLACAPQAQKAAGEEQAYEPMEEQTAVPAPVEEVPVEEPVEEVVAEAPSEGVTHQVDIVNFAYSPVEIKVKVGDSIRWTNKDSAPHTATAKDGSWDTGRLNKDQESTLTFDKPGTYEYYCKIHPSMKATVIVE